MEEQFIPYKQALELKELGFNEECFGLWEEVKETKEIRILYSNAINVQYLLNTAKHDDRNYHCKALLWQQAFDFFV